jgi:alpha-1,6-mannosyltransferase
MSILESLSWVGSLHCRPECAECSLVPSTPTTGASNSRRIIAAGCVCALAFGVVCVFSHRLDPLPVWLFFGAFGLAAMAYIWLFLLLPKTLSRSGFRLIVVGAILFRAIGFVGAPIYENDYFRYLWDGRTFAITGSPYGTAPAASFGDDTLPAPFPEILSQINYPDIPTIYGPVTELSFLLAYYVSPGALWPLKLLYIAADLATLWLLAKLMPFSRNLLLYAWSPLLIKEVAFTAHPDVLAAACMVAAVLALQSGRDIVGGLALAAGACARLSAGLLAPPFLRKSSKSMWAVAVLAAGALYAPFLLRGVADRGGLATFLSEWEFNSFGYGLLAAVAGSSVAKVACGALFLSFYSWAWWRRSDLLRPDIVLGIFFLLAPVVNPWYLVLLVPFVALRPSASGIAATLSVLLSYATGLNLGHSGGTFDHPGWVRPLEIAPVLLGLAYDLSRKGLSGPSQAE